MTREEIAASIGKCPGLNSFGVGIFRHGRGMTSEECDEKMQRGVDDLLANTDECARAASWLSGFRQRKTLNNLCDSYGLKHLAEEATGGYISNGALIAAAIHLGFRFKVDKGTWGAGPNVTFNIGKLKVPPASKK